MDGERRGSMSLHNLHQFGSFTIYVIQESLHPWDTYVSSIPFKPIRLGPPIGEGTFSVVEWTAHMLRKFNLLQSRASILQATEQLQAIQLTLSRLSYKKIGVFSASPSDVLDIWKELFQNSVLNYFNGENNPLEPSDAGENQFELDIGSQCQDPVMEEIHEACRMYKAFLETSLAVDHFALFSILKKALIEQHKELIDYLSSTTLSLEQPQSLSPIEKAILSLILPKAKIYIISAESSFHSILLDVSGVEEHLSISPDKDSRRSHQDKNNINSEPCVYSEKSVIVHIEVLKESISSVLDWNAGRAPHNDFVSPSILDSPAPVCRSIAAISPLATRLQKTPSSSKSLPSMPITPAIPKGKAYFIERVILSHIKLLINTRDELAISLILSIPGRDIPMEGLRNIQQEAKKTNLSLYQTILSQVQWLQLGGKGYQPLPDAPIRIYQKPLSEFVNFMIKLQSIIEEQGNPRKCCHSVISSICYMLGKLNCRVFPRHHLDRVKKSLADNLNRIFSSDWIVTESLIPPGLQNLQHLADSYSGCNFHPNILDALEDPFLTTPSRMTRLNSTPKSIISLFRSPMEAEEKELPLRVRLQQQDPSLLKKTPLRTRFDSCLAWAPADLSPIVLKERNPDTLDEEKVEEFVQATLKSKSRSKRSLLNNMKNLEGDEEVRKENEGKKQKTSSSCQHKESLKKVPKGKRLVKTKIKNADAIPGQALITKFFRK